jgi:hypothetical protein
MNLVSQLRTGMAAVTLVICVIAWVSVSNALKSVTLVARVLLKHAAAASWKIRLSTALLAEDQIQKTVHIQNQAIGAASRMVEKAAK